MSDKHIGNFRYGDIFKQEYASGEEGAKELLEDSKRLIRYIFQNDSRSADKSDSDLGERVLDNIYVISGGDTKKQLKLLNGFMIMSSPIVLENGEERYMNREELEASYPLRNMAMNAIAISIEMSANRILQMQDTIHNLTEALAISTKVKIDEQSNT